MAEFGLTGGIGSGKSSVAERLVARGAHLVDADATVRRLQRRGEPVFTEMVAHFGAGIVGDDGELDRAAVAAIVFGHADQLAALNKIVHPAVARDMTEQRELLAERGGLVVLDIPLLVDSDRDYGELAGIIVVDLPVELAVTRLVELRGFDEADARARIESQVSRDERLARADFVVDNSGDLTDLDGAVDRCWTWMLERAARLADR